MNFHSGPGAGLSSLPPGKRAGAAQGDLQGDFA